MIPPKLLPPKLSLAERRLLRMMQNGATMFVGPQDEFYNLGTRWTPLQYQKCIIHRLVGLNGETIPGIGKATWDRLRSHRKVRRLRPGSRYWVLVSEGDVRVRSPMWGRRTVNDGDRPSNSGKTEV